MQRNLLSPGRKSLAASVASLVLAMGLLTSHAAAQSARTQAVRHASAQKVHESADQIELNRRIQAADVAQRSGNPAAIESANRRLIAEGLLLMGKLRLAESAFPQAAQLYQSSLALEPQPDLYPGLAIALQLAGKQNEAIAEARKALARNPNDASMYITIGRANLATGDFHAAAKAFTRATDIKPNVDVLYSLAVAWLASKDPDARRHADAAFARMKATAGDSGSLHVLMGRAYRDAGLMPDAIKQFQRAIALDPATPHAHYFLGIAYLSQNEWHPTPQAQQQLEQAVKVDPHDFLSNYMLGFVYFSQRQYTQADKYLTTATQLNPTWPEPFLYLGMSAFARGDNKAAEPLLLKSVALTGTDVSRSNYEIRRAYVDLTRIFAREGKENLANEYADKAHQLENDVMQATQQRTTAMMEANGGKAGTMAAVVPLDKKEMSGASLTTASADAAAQLDAAALGRSNLTAGQLATAKTEESALRPILGQSYADLATAQAMQGHFATALTNFEAAEQWDSTLPSLEKNLGLAAYKAGNYSEAVHGLAAALKAEPQSKGLRAMLGMAYFGLQRYGDAANTFFPLGEAGMHDPTVGYAWAASLARDGDLKDATQVLNIYQSGQLTDEAQMLVGQLWTQIGNYAKAVSTLRGILARDPSFPKVHYYLGVAYIRANQWSDAAAELNAQRALTPHDPDTLYNLGFIDLEESRDAAAMQLFQQVVAAHPDYANAQYQIGKLLMNQNKPAQALPYLEAAARLDPAKAYVHYQLQAAYRKLGRTADANRELAVYEKIKTQARAQMHSEIQQMQHAQPTH